MWISCRWLNLPLQITTRGYVATECFLSEFAPVAWQSSLKTVIFVHATERAGLKYVRSEVQGDSFADSGFREYVLCFEAESVSGLRLNIS